jgi:hypothetical protein
MASLKYALACTAPQGRAEHTSQAVTAHLLQAMSIRYLSSISPQALWAVGIKNTQSTPKSSNALAILILISVSKYAFANCSPSLNVDSIILNLSTLLPGYGERQAMAREVNHQPEEVLVKI